MPDLAEIEHNPPLYRSGIGLYLHVPFCETKCPYCDFNTYSGIEDQIPGYVRAVENELRGWGNLLSRPRVRTIFLGGGTPSYLPADNIESILSTIRQSYEVDDLAEITMECNPGDVTPERAASWLGSGVNRISMGAQSFDDGLLKLLGRRHTAMEAQTAFQTLREAGFSNRSLDLMYGLPHQSLEQWTDSLDTALTIEPDHISLYGLQIEKGTPLAADVATGRYSVPDDDLAADMYEEAQRSLAAKGLAQYEISNWSKAGMESQHNLIYWRNEPYLGVGPGAHSWLAGQRFWNLKSPRRYVAVVADEYRPDGLDPVAAMRMPGGPVEQADVTTPAIDVAETMMMGMRLNEGVTMSRFAKRFGMSLGDAFPNEISRLLDIGLIEVTGDAIRLSERGRLLGNEVFAEFIGDE
ncbi:MAG: radical SAM family heme chaperone HemW [Chloroflexi bacterium]|nr:radical SAM family heme chaperone HemW [Chloroflexota bacterium]